MFFLIAKSIISEGDSFPSEAVVCVCKSIILIKWGCATRDPSRRYYLVIFAPRKIARDLRGNLWVFSQTLCGLQPHGWGCQDLNLGREVPNLEGYQTTPYPLI